ncbi:MAG TPA: glycosyltransferase family 2 protein [Blastocatellia bacterium]|nr:glycosyltransferase family 2 protein [Blastocatellia bacterium]
MTEGLPFVSIIMPVRNESGYIERSLPRVLQQDYPDERFEVIVADGCSSDRTPAIVESFKAEHLNLRMITNHGKIAPTGLNAALAEARGEIIIRIDGHCEVEPDYVRQCVRHLQNDGVDGVGGPLETVGETPLAGAIAAAMSSAFGVGGAAFRTVKNQTMLTDTVAFPAYTRAIIDLAGPFDEELVRNQDDEYNYRLRRLGAKILLAADVRARYYSRGTLSKLIQQYFQYGYWKVRVLQKHPFQMSPRQFVPPAFVAALIISTALALCSSLGFLLLGSIAGSYLAANLAASVWTARGSSWNYLPILPFVYLSLHLSYGLGFLIGLLKFADRWGRPD